MSTLLGLIGIGLILLGFLSLMSANDGNDNKKESNGRGWLIFLGIIGIFMFFSSIMSEFLCRLKL